MQVPSRFESKITSRNESSDEDYGQDVARRTHRKPDHPSIAGIKRRRQGTVDTNEDSDAYRLMSSRTGKAIDYNEKAVDYGLESDEAEEEAPRPKANAYYNSGKRISLSSTCRIAEHPIAADSDEIEGVFGYSRDDTRLDDPVDLPYENMVSLIDVLIQTILYSHRVCSAFTSNGNIFRISITPMNFTPT